MKYNVTQKDIDRGDPGSANSCPIFWAVSRASSHRPYVQCKDIWLDGDRYPLPDVAQKFVDAFDDGLPVEPFSFEVGP